MRGGKALGLEPLALAPRAQRRDGDGAIGWSKGGGAGLGDAAPGGIGQHRQRRHVRVLALIGRHALRRIALHMLDRAEVLDRRLFHILDGDIVLKVEPGPPAPRHRPERLQSIGRLLGLGQRTLIRLEPQRAQRLGRRLGPFTQTGHGRKGTVAGACRAQAGHHARHRHKGRDIAAPFGPPVHMAGQVQAGVPAARDGQAVGGNPFFATGMADGDPLQPLPPSAAADLTAPDHPHPIEARRVMTAVNQGRHMYPRRQQVAHGAMGIVIVAKHGDGAARADAPAVQISTHRAGGHDAGPVIVGKGDGALQRARRQHRPPRHDTPETFKRCTRAPVGAVMRDPLQRCIGALIIGPGNGGARHQTHILHPAQLGQHFLGPDRPRLAVNLVGLGQEAPAHARVLVGQDHIGPRTTRQQRRHQPRRPGADHQQITKGKGALIAVGIVLPRQGAQPGGAADHRLIQLLPEAARPHEGLVIEPRPQERRRQVVDRHQVKAQRGPAVLAPRLHPLVYLLYRGAHIGVLPPVAPHRNQRVGFLAASRQDAARAVVFERTPDQPHVIGQQGRGQRVALIPAVAHPVEGERDRPVPVDQPLALNPHRRASEASSQPSTSWVSVLRVTTSQAPQPKW